MESREDSSPQPDARQRLGELFRSTAELVSCRSAFLRKREGGQLLISPPESEIPQLPQSFGEEACTALELPDGSVLLSSPVIVNGSVFADAGCILPSGGAAGGREKALQAVSLMAAQGSLFFGEEALRKNAGNGYSCFFSNPAYLKKIIDTPCTGFAVLGTDARISFCNKAFASMLGYSPEELLNMEYSALLHPDEWDQDGGGPSTRQAPEGRSEKRFRHKGNRSFWGAVSASPLSEDRDCQGGTLLVLADITEHKRAQTLLNIQYELSSFLSSTSHLNDAAEKILDSCLQIDGIDCGSLYTIDVCTGDLELVCHRGLSPACTACRTALIPAKSPFMRMLESHLPSYAPRESFPGSKAGELFCLDPRVLGMAALPVLCEGELVAVLHFGSIKNPEIPKDARTTLESIASRIGGIFARIRVESAFRESEQRLRGIMDNSSSLIFIKDIDGVFLVVSRSLAQLVGKTVEEIEGCRDYDIFSGDYAAIYTAQDNEVLSSRGPREYETSIPTIDGLRILLLTKFPLYDDSGMVYAVGGIATDITERKKAEEILLREQSLFTEGPVVVFKWKCAEGWPIEYISPNFSQFGYDSQNFISSKKLFISLLHPDDLNRIALEVECFIQSGTERFEQDYRILCANGEIRWVYATTIIVRDADGEVAHFYGYVLDISERKQVEESLWESEERFRTIADFTYDWEYWLSPNGDFIYASPSVERITGFSADEFMEDPSLFQRIVVDDDHEPTIPCLSPSFSSQGVHSKQFEITTKDGRRRWIGHVCQPVYNHDGQLLGRRGSNRDITEERHATEALKKAKAEAEAAARIKSQFLANMSHEIRTPMNAIIGFTDLTLETSLSEQQRNNLKIVKSRSQDLLDLINDILDLSRIEAGKLKISPVSLSLQDMLHNLVSSFKPETENKKLSLSLVISSEVPDFIVADPLRLRQVLTNLIGNAIKFTQAGEITVSVRIARKDDMFPSFPHSSYCEYLPSKDSALLKFSVQDTGIGIPDSKKTQIFEAFIQADGSTAREYGGTGLGLAISSRLVELMGGRIWVDSEPGKGSVFNFTTAVNIPCPGTALPQAMQEARPEMHAAPQTQQPSEKPSVFRILVTEDDPSNQLLMKSLLESEGHSVFVASSGIESLAALKRESFDLILMDVQMPEMDGIELTRRIRSSGLPFQNIPIIAVTAFAMERDRERCFAAGMDDYLSKPIYEKTLRETIHKVKARGDLK